ncbi:PH domain-containing protein [Candidatus Chloroploca sp. M-50]|uniref:Helicase n=2 Tax=Candidatus Chloroploca TaxID=1579476 RepID=A0A2H3L3I7_9CHLR|nr:MULTISPECIES: PH domain-containing protein [Candidatus Chloroploca]MBP1468438.1 PH domain-containing protein [Candidatus Chloroploca mongolica]PDV96800.1 helicase [Candidatus Chloroploca asiatica]
MFQGLFGNASEVDAAKLEQELGPLLVEGEQLVRGFRVLRDMFVFTSKRLILIDKQGTTGRKVEYHSIPYKAITHFVVETAGTFDGDAELKIFLSSNPVPIEREFKRGTDIVGVQRTLATFVLG